MDTPQNKNNMSSRIEKKGSDEHHPLSDKWCLWAHLPHDTDWSIKSYKVVMNFSSVEEAIAVTETLPEILVRNCMLFLMRENIKPMWEDDKNRSGGCFSYKVTNKDVCKAWKELTYVTVGNTISAMSNFVNKVTGITISPKKNFCIIKVWMADCTNQNPAVVTSDVKGIVPQGCIFKKHAPEY
jgi:hypothetical protein